MTELILFHSANIRILIGFTSTYISILSICSHVDASCLGAVRLGPKVERERGGIVDGLGQNQEWDPSLFLTHTSTLQVQ